MQKFLKVNLNYPLKRIYYNFMPDIRCLIVKIIVKNKLVTSILPTHVEVQEIF